MRSRTEARFAARLDNLGLEWQYEPQCFADATGQYLPDFRVSNRGCRSLYIEVKGILARDELPTVRHRMEIIWASEPDAQLLLVVTSSGDTWFADGTASRSWCHYNAIHWTQG